mgnify:CR=1 FL=1
MIRTIRTVIDGTVIVTVVRHEDMPLVATYRWPERYPMDVELYHELIGEWRESQNHWHEMNHWSGAALRRAGAVPKEWKAKAA